MKLKFTAFVLVSTLVFSVIFFNRRSFAYSYILRNGVLYKVSTGAVLSDNDSESDSENSQEDTEDKEVKEVKEVKESKEVKEKPEPVEPKEVEHNVNSVRVSPAKDGKVKIEAKTESDSHDNEVDTEDMMTFEDSEDSHDVLEIQSEDSSKGSLKIKVEGKEMKVDSNGVSTTSSFPLSVDAGTNTLIVTTPSGNVSLKTLPSEAVNNLIRNNKIETVVDSELSQESSTSGESLVYKVNGLKTKRLFGVLPVVIKVQAKVGANNGSILEVSNPWFQNVFGFLFTD